MKNQPQKLPVSATPTAAGDCHSQPEILHSEPVCQRFHNARKESKPEAWFVLAYFCASLERHTKTQENKKAPLLLWKKGHQHSPVTHAKDILKFRLSSPTCFHPSVQEHITEQGWGESVLICCHLYTHILLEWRRLHSHHHAALTNWHTLPALHPPLRTQAKQLRSVISRTFFSHCSLVMQLLMFIIMIFLHTLWSTADSSEGSQLAWLLRWWPHTASPCAASPIIVREWVAVHIL